MPTRSPSPGARALPSARNPHPLLAQPPHPGISPQRNIPPFSSRPSTTLRRAACLLLGTFCLTLASLSRAASVPPPKIPREFRGVWIATVNNIDWPSKPGLPQAQQQAELRALFDLAARIRLNAVVFQVRPAGDAFYLSPYEPWSEYLTGRMGQGPTPLWDPLKFAVDEAHARGLELHAWFNPFRARMARSTSPVATNHISRTAPHLVRDLGDKWWCDPGEPETREHAQKVILDVVRRYEVDGIHLDDYFYPYPQFPWSQFPDQRSWQRYQKSGGRLSLGDWRRENVNRFVQELGVAIHREKPWVKFGISPFGIWRPGQPAPIRGMDAFEVIHADARKWFQEGWVDYLSPQLYWTIQPREQSFPLLLQWWSEQNVLKRHLWPGVASARIGEDRNAREISNQVQLIRKDPGAEGVVFWNASSLRDNRGGVTAGLSTELFREPALVPPSPWLDKRTPPTPSLTIESEPRASRFTLRWTRSGVETISWFVVQSRYGRRWTSEVLPYTQTTRVFNTAKGTLAPEEILVTPISKSGIAGDPARWTRHRLAAHTLPTAGASEAQP